MGLESGSWISDLVAGNPLGSDDRSTADDHLRLIKNVLKLTFPQLTGEVSLTQVELNLLDGLLADAAELNLLNNRSLASSDDVIDNFPAGTLMTFQQTAAPTGWTKETTHDNKAFRVVSGAVGSGGTDSFSTVFGLQATDAHTLVEAEIPTHDHGVAGDHTHNTKIVSTGSNGTTSADGTNVAGSNKATSLDGDHTHDAYGGGSPAHSHNIDLRVQYVDLIIASKD